MSHQRFHSWQVCSVTMKLLAATAVIAPATELREQRGDERAAQLPLASALKDTAGLRHPVAGRFLSGLYSPGTPLTSLRRKRMNPRGEEDTSYALLTAAYNEERYIEKTLRSVLAQLLRPKIWVIASDGSTDRTDDIVQQYAMRHSFIRLVRRERDHSREFASKVFALRAGFQTLTLVPIDFIGHLDADVSVAPSYFRDLLAKFSGDPELGIAGGWYLEERRDGVWRSRPVNSTGSIPGGIQMFRRECYEDVGEMLPIEYGGEDWYAEVRARMCGWRVRSFPELAVHHLRASGSRGGLLRHCYREGLMDFALGSHPLFEIAKVAKMSATPPYLLNALLRMLGFLVAHVYGKRMVPPAFVAFLQREQLGRLWTFVPSAREKQG